MKKFLFSALACVAFAGSSFASNEVVHTSSIKSLSNSKTNAENNFEGNFGLKLENGILLTVSKVYSDLGDCSWVIVFTNSRGQIVNMQISPVYGDTTSGGCEESFNGAMQGAIKLAKERGFNVSGQSTWVAY